MEIATADPVRWIVELEAAAEELMNSQLSLACEWFPHQAVGPVAPTALSVSGGFGGQNAVVVLTAA